jgi:hypothetical protein
MKPMRRICFVVVFLMWGILLCGQGPSPSATAPAKTVAAPAPASLLPAAQLTLAEIVKAQFGPGFEVVNESPMSKLTGAVDVEPRGAWQPLFTGDFDGDGIEDAVIVARNKNPNIEAAAYNYKVFDPYNDHFGYGDPKVTIDFNSQDPYHSMQLLIIHGAGSDGWRSATPKAKFVIINVPFEQVALSRGVITIKKKKVTVAAIRVEESDTVSSVVFWDGKKYRYIPGGGTP